MLLLLVILADAAAQGTHFGARVAGRGGFVIGQLQAHAAFLSC